MEDFERDRIVDVRGNATAMSISVSTQEVETRDIEFRIRDSRVQPGFTETDNMRRIVGSEHRLRQLV